ncbi:MAG: helix-turn-helix domain-containing protein [Phycisphaera sp.]|nr:MAG: helix-turn-helix domain-containing protein [Phycisphaera sp.]
MSLTSTEATTTSKLTTRELAREWRISERTVFDLRTNYGLPFVRMAGSIRFDRQAVEAWAEAGTEGGAQ